MAPAPDQFDFASCSTSAFGEAARALRAMKPEQAADRVVIQAVETEEAWLPARKCKKTAALDTGARAVTMADILNLERFQVHPNGKSRFGTS
jgi:hypothetical protein